jgi:hypothetical protein
MARKAFFSFHYKPDGSRASQVRNMGMIEGNAPVPTTTGKQLLAAVTPR